jgi:hypothetical protein
VDELTRANPRYDGKRKPNGELPEDQDAKHKSVDLAPPGHGVQPKTLFNIGPSSILKNGTRPDRNRSLRKNGDTSGEQVDFPLGAFTTVRG